MAEIANVRYFSILSDGSTDQGIIEQELIFVRYVTDRGKIVTKLADIVALEQVHAIGVENGILEGDSSIEISLPILSDKLICVNTDGAAFNLGSKGGAVKLLLDEINLVKDRPIPCESYITVVHCVAHNLELATCDLKKDCAYLNKFDDTLKGI